MAGTATSALPARSPVLRPRPGLVAGWADRHFALIASAPTIAVMALVFGVPLLFSLYLSMQGWSIDKGLLDGTFVGFANFADLVDDPEFTHSLTLTLFTTAAAVAAELAIGLLVALLLNRDVKLIGFFRTVLIVPMMMTPIVAALCWKLLLDPGNGIVNWLIGRPIVWLGDPDLALGAVTLVNVWQNAPYVAILLLAGLRSLPSEPVEAACIDGAGRLQVFWHVTLPLLRPYILVALLLRTIFEFRAFDNVYVMTSGGPANATMLLSVFTYLTSFVRFDLSLGAAASWMMLGIVLVMCVAFILTLRRRSTL